MLKLWQATELIFSSTSYPGASAIEKPKGAGVVDL